MRRSVYLPILTVVVTLSILWALPEAWVRSFRSKCIRKLAVLPIAAPTYQTEIAKSKAEAENALLRSMLLQFQEEDHLRRISKATTVIGRLIYQDQGPRHKGCWVDVGSEDNARLGQEIVAHHSPVVIGNCLIGLVDQVFPTQSHIRFLSDAAVRPAVRAVRGNAQHVLLAQHVTEVIQAMPADSPQAVRDYLQHWKDQMGASTKEWFLAKGILEGCSSTSERVLHGKGFNCDLADRCAPARELRSGRILGEGQETAQPLLQKGDILMTTGMDGVFPMGLIVAKVVYVHPLIEGDCYYQLEAEWLAPSLDRLYAVCILPPPIQAPFQVTSAMNK